MKKQHHPRSTSRDLLGGLLLAPFARGAAVMAALALLAVPGLRAQTTQYATGSGGFTWDNGTTAKWGSSSGGPYDQVWTSGNDAVFEGTAGTVSIAAAAATAHNLTFNTTGYTIAANTLTLNGDTPTITLGTGKTATISSTFAGADRTLTGGGTLTFSGTYPGVTYVTNSTLKLSGSGSTSTTITVNNGGLLTFESAYFNMLASCTNSVVVNSGGVVNSGSGATPGAQRLNNPVLAGGTLRGTGGFGTSWGAFGLTGTLSVTADSSILNGSGTNNLIAPPNSSQTLIVNVSSGATLTCNLPFQDFGTGKIYTITKSGPGTALFTVASTYTGATTVSDGTLRVNGSLGSSSAVTVNGTGTLGGTGTVYGTVTVASGGTLAPGGTSIGTLTMGKTLTLQSGGTSAFRINKSGSVKTSDLATGMSGVTYGGTLQVTATGDALASGDKFILFTKAGGSYGGSFSTLSLPTLTGNLLWDTSGLLVDGSITVTAPSLTATPTFTPGTGGYIGAQTVTLGCTTPGATIYYTTNGTTPTSGSPSGSSGLTVNVPTDTNMTIQAYAHLNGYTDSAVASATYHTHTGAVWTNPAGGSWASAGNWLDGAIGQGTGITADFSTLTLPANAVLTLDSSPVIGHLVFGDAGNARTWTVNAGFPAGTLTMAGTNTPVITVNNQTTTINAGFADTARIKAGTGTLTFGGAYPGMTYVNGGTLMLNAAGAANTTITVNNGGLLTFGYQCWRELEGCTTSAIVNAGGVVDSGGSDTGAESLNNVTLAGGTLRGTGGYFSSWGAFSLLGTLTVTADSVIQDGGGGNNWITPGAGSGLLTISVASGATLTDGMPFADLNTTKYTLTKSGLGTAIFNAANTYTGTTTVNAGALLVNGNHSGTGAVTVASGATLGGTGSIGGNVSYASGALAKFTQGSPLAITGTLTLNSNVVHLTLPSNLTAGTYTLATYNPTGSTGSFATTPVIDSGSLATGATATVTTNAGTVVLTVGTPYQQWLATNSRTGTQADLNEYAFGTSLGSQIVVNSPTSITLGQAPAMQIAGTAVSAVYGRRQNYQASGLTYKVKFSADLATWYDGTDTANLKYAGSPDLNNPAVVASQDGMDAVSIPFPLFIKTANGYEKTNAFMTIEVTTP